jgi:hypothetical protein
MSIGIIGIGAAATAMAIALRARVKGSINLETSWLELA